MNSYKVRIIPIQYGLTDMELTRNFHLINDPVFVEINKATAQYLPAYLGDSGGLYVKNHGLTIIQDSNYPVMGIWDGARKSMIELSKTLENHIVCLQIKKHDNYNGSVIAIEFLAIRFGRVVENSETVIINK